MCLRARSCAILIGRRWGLDAEMLPADLRHMQRVSLRLSSYAGGESHWLLAGPSPLLFRGSSRRLLQPSAPAGCVACRPAGFVPSLNSSSFFSGSSSASLAGLLLRSGAIFVLSMSRARRRCATLEFPFTATGAEAQPSALLAIEAALLLFFTSLSSSRVRE